MLKFFGIKKSSQKRINSLEMNGVELQDMSLSAISSASLSKGMTLAKNIQTFTTKWSSGSLKRNENVVLADLESVVVDQFETSLERMDNILGDLEKALAPTDIPLSIKPNQALSGASLSMAGGYPSKSNALAKARQCDSSDTLVDAENQLASLDEEAKRLEQHIYRDLV